MPQLSLYLDKETHAKIVDAAKREEKSLSSWARQHLSEAAAPNGWPPGYFEFLRNIDIDVERPPQITVPDAPRESF